MLEIIRTIVKLGILVLSAGITVTLLQKLPKTEWSFFTRIFVFLIAALIAISWIQDFVEQRPYTNLSLQKQQVWQDIELSERLNVPGAKGLVVIRELADALEEFSNTKAMEKSEEILKGLENKTITEEQAQTAKEEVMERVKKTAKERSGDSDFIRSLYSNKISQAIIQNLKKIWNFKTLFGIVGAVLLILSVKMKRTWGTLALLLVLFFLYTWLFNGILKGGKTEASSQPSVQQQEKTQQAPARSNNRRPIRPLLNQPLVITLQPGEETEDFVRRPEGANWHDIEPTGKTKVIPYYQGEKGYTDGPGINPIVPISEGPNGQLFKLKNLEDKPVKVVLTFRYVKK